MIEGMKPPLQLPLVLALLALLGCGEAPTSNLPDVAADIPSTAPDPGQPDPGQPDPGQPDPDGADDPIGPSDTAPDDGTRDFYGQEDAACAATEEACDDLDDDCDGETDEGCDDDGDDYCDQALVFVASQTCPHGGGDCDDDTAEVNPGAEELCDGLDNDCDEAADGHSRDCSNSCGEGTETCIDGSWQPCTVGPPECTGGACCDGCNYLAADTVCGSEPLSTQYVCEGECAGTIRKEELFAVCSGDSQVCDPASSLWIDGGVTETCGEHELCETLDWESSCKLCTGGCDAGVCTAQPKGTICVDPAYGGTEAGPSGNGLVGKEITLAIADALEALLEADSLDANGGGTWTVVRTRTDDSTVSYASRAAVCGFEGADAIVSIALNCCGSEGVEAHFYHGDHQPLAAKLVDQLVAVSDFAALDPPTTQSSDNGLLGFAGFAKSAVAFAGFIDHAGDAAKLADADTIALGLLYAIQQEWGYATFTPGP